MKTISIVQASGRSEGISKWAIMDFCGKPLIAWSILQAKENSSVDEVYVTSDDDEILLTAERYGAVRIRQPITLASPISMNKIYESNMLHALDEIEKYSNKRVGIVIFLQANTPLRAPEDITDAVRKLHADKADILFSSVKLESLLTWEKTDEGFINLGCDVEHRISRAHYIENSSIYVFKPEILRNHNKLGNFITTFEMEFWKTLRADDLADRDLCESYFEKYILKKTYSLSAEDIDLIVYDFDGVMTDNKVFTLQDGTEAVIVNRSDGLAINLIKKSGLPQIIISTESNPVVEARAKKVGLPAIYNTKNKLESLQEHCNQHSYRMSRVIYLGNDINDLEAMNAVGIAVAPFNAHPAIKKISKLVLKHSGGDGVIRELADLILHQIKIL
ncbi:hypothetical protein C4588_06735 [Candidatus Parcubacteria bacterium]|jgi:N-acylneuraminate cytidylyltransferase|nr:MAG: hypothetical protein C4588_06735 [Candidatus Parcubacteria bacterium]